jgi:uncharacterized membrane protein
MSTAVSIQSIADAPAGRHARAAGNVRAQHALTAAARCWFAVAIGGQLMQAVYVVWFYGGTALRGRLDAWGSFLWRGYVRGDGAGNAALVVHLAAAVILVVGGGMQFVPQIRQRAPRLHRWVGRIYILTAVATSIAGLYLTWIRGTRGDFSQHLGGSLNAVLIILCAALAVRSAVVRRFDAHRRWVLRLFMVVSGAWFYRVGLFLWLLLNQGPAGFDPLTFRGPALTAISFANSLLPLILVEIYLRVRTAGGTVDRLALAGLIVALTIAMGMGILGATAGMWLPMMRAVTARF